MPTRQRAARSHPHGAPPPTQPILVPPKGIAVRQSTDIMLIGHEGIARALAFIRDHYREQIGMRDIARAAGISVSTLVANFRRHVHQTVHHHVNKRRLDHACRLLRETTAHMDIVAEQSGFPSSRRMSKVFRRELNCSPRDYRQR
jgi:LacI family transcriptional regulator